jgi:hypothetical protein
MIIVVSPFLRHRSGAVPALMPASLGRKAVGRGLHTLVSMAVGPQSKGVVAPLSRSPKSNY